MNYPFDKVSAHLGSHIIPAGCEMTKAEMSTRIHILGQIVQGLIDHLGEKQGKELGVIQIASTDGYRYGIIERQITSKEFHFRSEDDANIQNIPKSDPS